MALIGDHGDSMMAVVVGTVRISRPMSRGKEIILADFGSGELFGEIALLDGKPRSANPSRKLYSRVAVMQA
jgi:CRP-like cAMP-binding protein